MRFSDFHNVCMRCSQPLSHYPTPQNRFSYIHEVPLACLEATGSQSLRLPLLAWGMTLGICTGGDAEKRTRTAQHQGCADQ